MSIGIVYIKHYQKWLLAMTKDVVVTFLLFLRKQKAKRDRNARKGKRSTPPITNDKDSPESTLEDIDSDRDVADTGKDGGLRQSGRI
jgi:hypothetical protein